MVKPTGVSQALSNARHAASVGRPEIVCLGFSGAVPQAGTNGIKLGLDYYEFLESA